jgi:hypothetical protein
LDHSLPFSIARTVAWLAVVGVGVTTFRWATIRGFPAFDNEGRIQVEHIIRSLVMTGVMSVVVVLASAPIFLLVAELSKK